MMQMQAAQAIFWHRIVEMCVGWSIDAIWYITASWSLSIFPGFKNNRGTRKHKVTCVAIPLCYLRHAEFFLIAGAAVL